MCFFEISESRWVNFCLSAKSGSMAFKQLLIRHTSGKFASHAPVAWLITDMILNNASHKVDCKRNHGENVVFVRDPLERFLSGYLWIVQQPDRFQWLNEKWTNRKEDFEKYVSKYYEQIQYPKYFKNDDYNQHLLPDKCYCRYQRNKPCFCNSLENKKTYHLSNMSEWYEEFVSEFGLNETVNDKRWSSKRGAFDGRWWTPQRRTTNGHQTSSKHKMQVYYSNVTILSMATDIINKC